jgi:hypothetical protein
MLRNSYMLQRSVKIMSGVVLGISVCVAAFFVYKQHTASVPVPGPEVVVKKEPAPASTQVKQPESAAIPNPDGSSAWPEMSASLNMVERANQGTGRIVIHNYSSNPLYIKICVADGQPCYGDRHVYVSAHSTFIVPRLDKNQYQIRVRTINAPHYAAASDAFIVEDRMTRIVPIGDVPMKHMPNAVLLKALDVDQF